MKRYEEQALANKKANETLQSEVQKLGIRIKVDLADICGEYKDEVSLLNQISGAYFQCIPEYNVV